MFASTFIFLHKKAFSNKTGILKLFNRTNVLQTLMASKRANHFSKIFHNRRSLIYKTTGERDESVWLTFKASELNFAIRRFWRDLLNVSKRTTKAWNWKLYAIKIHPLLAILISIVSNLIRLFPLHLKMRIAVANRLTQHWPFMVIALVMQKLMSTPFVCLRKLLQIPFIELNNVFEMKTCVQFVITKKSHLLLPNYCSNNLMIIKTLHKVARCTKCYLFAVS